MQVQKEQKGPYVNHVPKPWPGFQIFQTKDHNNKMILQFVFENFEIFSKSARWRSTILNMYGKISNKTSLSYSSGGHEKWRKK